MHAVAADDERSPAGQALQVPGPASAWCGFGVLGLIDSGLVGSTNSRDLSGRGAARAENAQGKPDQSHISPSILAYEDNCQGCITQYSKVDYKLGCGVKG